ncbi:MAG: hypothetical protein H6540_00610 [Bacteroidales bacterium]|nr:hypothetical protein [Bacteroidales bacterium]
MHTSGIHISTSFLPLFSGLGAVVFLWAGRNFNKVALTGFALRLFILSFLLTTLTCGFGGASMRFAEADPSLHMLVLKSHTWTAMISFLLSFAMAFLAYRMLKGRSSIQKHSLILHIISAFYFIFFAITLFLAFRIW